MKIDETKTQRQYHYNDLHTVVTIDQRVTIQDTPRTLRSIHLKNKIGSKFVNERMDMIRKDALRSFLKDDVRWEDLRFEKLEQNGLTYISVIKRESGRVLRILQEKTWDRFVKEYRFRPGHSFNISG
jgi:hypothetical protein